MEDKGFYVLVTGFIIKPYPDNINIGEILYVTDIDTDGYTNGINHLNGEKCNTGLFEDEYVKLENYPEGL